MKIELDYIADISINHRYKSMEIDIEDSYSTLSEQIISSVFAEKGIEVLFEGLLSEEDLRSIYLYFKEDFDRIIEKEKGETL